MAAASALDPAAAEAGEGLAARLNEAAKASLGGTSRISACLIRCDMRSFWPGPLVDLTAALARARRI
jgi:hypothetical protein